MQVHLQQTLGTRVRLNGLKIQVDQNGVVVLRGQVESEHARRLAENLVRLEPGVREVRNELQVARPGSSEQ